MSSFINIYRPTQSNRGGIIRLLIVDSQDIENSTFNTINGYVDEPIRLKESIQWIELFPTPSSIDGTESTTRLLANSLYRYTVKFEIAKDTPEKLNQFRLMEKKRFIVLVQNRNLEWIIIGSPSEPAQFSFNSRNSGKKALDKNALQLEFSATRREPAPFYRVYATFYVNQYGDLMFDNTFDPTLSASINATTSQLTIAGPNSAKYSINSNGYLIYTP